jgi:hypothetical protein
MEPQPKVPAQAPVQKKESAESTGGQQMAPPSFALAASPVQRKSVTDDATLSDYEKNHHGLSMEDLVKGLITQPRDFTGAFREFVLAGKGLFGNQGRTLAATEAVIGYAYSPVAKTWMEGALKTNPDQVKAIQSLTGKTFDWHLDEAELGTEKTTAPIASNMESPNMVLQKELFHETWLYEMSKAVMAWADPKADSTSGIASFSYESLSGDKTLGKSLKTKTTALITKQFPDKKDHDGNPKTNYEKLHMNKEYGTIDYNWILRFMVQNNLITPPGKSSEEFSYNKTLGAIGVEFSRKDAAVAKTQQDVTKRALKLDPKKGAYDSEDIDMKLSSDRTQKKAEQTLMDAVTDLEAKVAAELDATKKAKYEEQLKAAKAKLAATPAYRTFAKSNMPLIERLTKLNTTFSLGTYIHHSWGQHSADMFLSTSLKADGFWKESVVNQLFDDLNTAAEMDERSTGGAGKFAWRAIYNDVNVAKETNKKYGAGRQLTGIPGHGPDKIHIHLDIRALDLEKDTTTGYKTDALTGRVQA